MMKRKKKMMMMCLRAQKCQRVTVLRVPSTTRLMARGALRLPRRGSRSGRPVDPIRARMKCSRQVFSMAAMNKEGGSAFVATRPDSPSPVPLPPGKPALPGAEGTPFGCPPRRKEKPTDPVEWTVMDVVEYFTEVLTGLSIHLGPALKIYEHHIKVLQQGHFEDDDPDGFLG